MKDKLWNGVHEYMVCLDETMDVVRGHRINARSGWGGDAIADLMEHLAEEMQATRSLLGDVG